MSPNAPTVVENQEKIRRGKEAEVVSIEEIVIIKIIGIKSIETTTIQDTEREMRGAIKRGNFNYIIFVGDIILVALAHLPLPQVLPAPVPVLQKRREREETTKGNPSTIGIRTSKLD